MAKLKGAALLQGWRGEPARDVEALCDCVLRIGAFIRARPEIAEIEINPLVLYAKGRGALATPLVLVPRPETFDLKWRCRIAAMRRPRLPEYCPVFGLPASLPGDARARAISRPTFRDGPLGRGRDLLRAERMEGAGKLRARARFVVEPDRPRGG